MRIFNRYETVEHTQHFNLGIGNKYHGFYNKGWMDWVHKYR